VSGSGLGTFERAFIEKTEISTTSRHSNEVKKKRNLA
jgi:hypothetical protein